MLEFKDRLKFLRENYYRNGKKLSQKELANVLNYGYTAIANYESGRNEPSIEDLIKLAEFFNVSLDYLLGVSEERHLYQSVTNNDFIALYNTFNPEQKKEIYQILESIFHMIK